MNSVVMRSSFVGFFLTAATERVATEEDDNATLASAAAERVITFSLLFDEGVVLAIFFISSSYKNLILGAAREAVSYS